MFAIAVNRKIVNFLLFMVPILLQTIKVTSILYFL